MGRRSLILLGLACLVAAAVSAPVSAAEGTVITFVSGTGSTGGSLSVTNAATGSTTTSSLAQNLPAEACATILSIAAPKIGLKTELSGATVRILGRGAVVKVIGATITKADLPNP